MRSEYYPNEIEQAAQKYWAENKVFEVKEDEKLEKFYCLSMFPYPSGKLHIGHIRNYAIGDAIARFQKMLGKNVLQPMGWDAFGLPAENAAIERGLKASKWTRENIQEMKAQMSQMGFGFDWSREVATCDPNYYLHEQWFFTQLIKKGLAYRKIASVNWDPIENTVLANEQVIDGKGYRSGAVIEKKQIAQWFIKSTKYLEPLLEGIDNQLENWPNLVKVLQKDWIGKSKGLSLKFNLQHSFKNLDKQLEVFTTRADTLMGVSFMAIATEHPISLELIKSVPGIKEFVDECKKLNQKKKGKKDVEKIGFEIPIDLIAVIHPISGKKIPIWITNYVLIEYGTGAVMAVPAHDKRDYDFAQKYQLPVLPVIENPNSKKDSGNHFKVYCGYGKTCNSGEISGLDFGEAVEAVFQKLSKTKQATKAINYKMHDWGVSRQRYWGCPIPILWDEEGDFHPVDQEDLPVKLPEDVEFSGSQSPLDNTAFINFKKNNQTYRRESDTFDTFVESSWYFLRYCCPDAKKMVDERINYWMPVDQYVGGIEHATMHLIYARVFQRMMKEFGLVKDEEPFKRLICQGMVVGPYYYREEIKKGNLIKKYFSPNELEFLKDKQGTILKAIHKQDGNEVFISKKNVKISKSKRNGKDPLEIAKRYSADTLRLFMLFTAPVDKALIWNEGGLEGVHRFLKRLYRGVYQLQSAGLINQYKKINIKTLSKEAMDLYIKLQQTIQKVELSLLSNYQFNTAIAANMELLNQWMVFEAVSEEENALKLEVIQTIVLMLSPITPHICHQLWLDLGNNEPLVTKEVKYIWPAIDGEYLLSREIALVIQVNGKSRSKAIVSLDIDDDGIKKIAMNDMKVIKLLENGTLRKTIVVNQAKRKLVNLVIN